MCVFSVRPPHADMLHNLAAYGHDVIFVDTTHDVNMYRNKLFAVAVKVRSCL